MGRVRTRVERLEQLTNAGQVSNVTGTAPIVVTTTAPGVRNVSTTLTQYTDQQAAAAQRRFTGTASGTNTYAVTTTPSHTAYVAGDLLIITFTNANTGASTLNDSSLGARAVQYKGSALVGGEISAGARVILLDDGTQLQLVGISRLDDLTLQGTDIASAATTNIATATGRNVNITGTTTITALGTAAAGVERVTRFTGSLTLTHNATSMILLSGANIVTVADDECGWKSLGSGNWVMQWYSRKDGTPLTNTAATVTLALLAGIGIFSPWR